ncbi:MAG: hypothetical protein RR539_10185 [Clostridium sp.]|uniref:hypothetical protein n=2 Tax=Clostridium sp. TaxID=1506 RepID=UPI002FCCA475
MNNSGMLREREDKECYFMVNEKRSYRFYIFYLLGFLGFCYLNSVIVVDGLLKGYDVFEANYYGIIYASVFVNILFGVFISLDHLLKQKRNSGVWMVNMPKILVLGTALGFIFLYYVLYNSGVSILPDSIGAVLSDRKYSSMWNFVFIFLGYVIGSSFYKAEKELDI